MPIRCVECVSRVMHLECKLLTSFSVYVIVYEQSLGFTNIFKHVYGAFQACDFLHTFNATCRQVRYSLPSFYYILLVIIIFYNVALRPKLNINEIIHNYNGLVQCVSKKYLN